MTMSAVRPLHILAKDWEEKGHKYTFEHNPSLSARQRALWCSKGVQALQSRFSQELANGTLDQFAGLSTLMANRGKVAFACTLER